MAAFSDLLKGIKGGAFWMTAARWRDLIWALERDRVVIQNAPGIIVTPTPNGRYVSGLGGSGGETLIWRVNVGGVATDVVVTSHLAAEEEA